VLIHAEKEDERRDHDEPASNTNHARQNPCPDTGEQANDKNFHGVSTGAVMFSLVFTYAKDRTQEKNQENSQGNQTVLEVPLAKEDHQGDQDAKGRS
jgi:hypothetical protein